MTPQPQQEYIITEMQVKRILILMNRDSVMDLDEFKEIADELRSRPAPLTHTEHGDCLVICQHCGKVTQVQCTEAAQAREKVLDELTHKLIELVIIDGTTEFVKFPRHAISTAINSLLSREVQE